MCRQSAQETGGAARASDLHTAQDRANRASARWRAATWYRYPEGRGPHGAKEATFEGATPTTDEIRAILFDLDGTLLDIDGDQFFSQYVDALATFLAADIDSETFRNASLVAGAAVMTASRHEESNHAMLLRVLSSFLSLDAGWLEARMAAFSSGPLGHVGTPWARFEGARHVVSELAMRGFGLAVATSPIYPLPVITERLRRAGVEDAPWRLVSGAEVMHSMKPYDAYFLELAELLQMRPQECLVVGDDPFQDLAAAHVGMQTFYVGRRVPGMRTTPQGTLADLLTLLPQAVGFAGRGT